MDKSIKDIIDELKVKIKYSPFLDDEAHYISECNLIVVNSNRDEFDMTKSLLHELGHAAKDQGNEALYRATFTMHSKMENDAEEFMIKNLVRQYLALNDTDPKNVNYMNFIENYELDISKGDFVREAFLEFGQ